LSLSSGFAEQESPPLLKEDFLSDRPVNFNSIDGNVNPVLFKNVVPETSPFPTVLILIKLFVSCVGTLQRSNIFLIHSYQILLLTSVYRLNPTEQNYHLIAAEPISLTMPARGNSIS
jgi:hypothetical protein